MHKAFTNSVFIKSFTVDYLDTYVLVDSRSLARLRVGRYRCPLGLPFVTVILDLNVKTRL